MQATERNDTDEYEWEEVKRVRRPARQLRKVVVVPDNLGPDDETRAILDRIASKRFFGDW